MADVPTPLNLALFPNLSLPRIGLLATQAIRGGDNRTVLQRIKKSGDIFMAWSDKEWVLEGAAVNVSIVGFAINRPTQCMLDDLEVTTINADLTTGLDTTSGQKISEMAGLSFQGPVKVGAFDLGSVSKPCILPISLHD